MESNYLQLYIYRLKKKHRNEFLEIQRKAGKIYRRYGAGEEEMFLLHDGKSKYGLKGISSVLPCADKEEMWIGITRYKNAEHCKQVMSRVNSDPRIECLFRRAIQILHPPSRHVRGEFGK